MDCCIILKQKTSNISDKRVKISPKDLIKSNAVAQRSFRFHTLIDCRNTNIYKNDNTSLTSE